MSYINLDTIGFGFGISNRSDTIWVAEPIKIFRRHIYKGMFPLHVISKKIQYFVA